VLHAGGFAAGDRKGKTFFFCEKEAKVTNDLARALAGDRREACYAANVSLLIQRLRERYD
jgi:hypothetical protein